MVLMRNTGWRSALMSLVTTLALWSGPGVVPASAGDPIVFAAASLRNALDDVVSLYADETGETVLVSYAGTATLARQIEHGAPADLFFGADVAWMDELEDFGLIRPQTRHTLLGNQLVLIRPKDFDAAVDIARGMDLVAQLGAEGRLALADTQSVPAGRYARAALETLDAWDALVGRTVETDNVRTALAFVARGEVPLGIVYATDAISEPAVTVLGTFPEDSHPPIRYPVAMTTGSTDPSAAAFLDFLRSPAARPAFEAQGFTIVDPSS